MADITQVIKNNWPIAVGGVVGLYLVFKFMGSSGGQTSQTVTASGIDPATYAALAQASNTAQAQQAQIALAQNQLNAQISATANQQAIDAANNNNAAQVAFVQSQGQVAGQVASAATGIIAALEMPAINAMNSATAQNAQTMQSAAQVASAGFLAQGGITSNALQNVTALAGAVNASNNAMASAVGQTANMVIQGGQQQVQAIQTNAQLTASNNNSWMGLGALALLTA